MNNNYFSVMYVFLQNLKKILKPGKQITTLLHKYNNLLSLPSSLLSKCTIGKESFFFFFSQKIENLEIGFLIGAFPIITSFYIIELKLELMGEEIASKNEVVERLVTLIYINSNEDEDDN